MQIEYTKQAENVLKTARSAFVFLIFATNLLIMFLSSTDMSFYLSSVLQSFLLSFIDRHAVHDCAAHFAFYFSSMEWCILSF